MRKQELLEDKLYCDRIYPKIKLLLEKIFDSKQLSESFDTLTKVRVLIPCAGTFPSYGAFLDTMKKYFPKVKSIDFVLLDPNREDLNLFEERIQQSEQVKNIEKNGTVKVKIQIYAEELITFLLREHNKFNMIYFEHPVIDSMNVLLAHFHIVNPGVLSLRTAFPYLTNALLPNGVIIAACKSDAEIYQMQIMLDYSLGLQSQSISTASSLVFPTDFSKAITCSARNVLIKKSYDQHAHMKEIKSSDKMLTLFFAIGAILYVTNFANPNYFFEQTASALLLWGQFLFHRPGKTGFAIKVILCLSQAACFLRQADSEKILNLNSIVENNCRI